MQDPAQRISAASLHCRSNFLSGTIVRVWVSPPLSPRRGYPVMSRGLLFTIVLPSFRLRLTLPNTVGFLMLARHYYIFNCGRARRKPPSSLTLQTGSPTTGLDFSMKNSSFVHL